MHVLLFCIMTSLNFEDSYCDILSHDVVQYSTLKIIAAYSSEKLISAYKTTMYHNSEDYDVKIAPFSALLT